MIPNDPVMLLSFLNARLRDEYENLEDLCSSLDISSEEICEKLKTIQYQYSSEQNQFI